MPIKITPKLAATLAAAGIQLPYPEPEGKKAKKPLPDHCILSDGPPCTRREVVIARWHPTRLNLLKAAHWAREGRLKYADACVIGDALRRGGVTRAVGKRRVTLEIVLGPRQRGGDGDAYWKSLLDGMVRCGALKDDNRQHCETNPVVYSRHSMIMTRITLEDI